MSTDVLLCCFDALDLELLDRYESETPTFHEYFDSGVGGPLDVTFPPFTPSTWPSMFTGTGPGDHGIFSFFSFDGYPDQHSPVSLADIHVPAVWDYLDERGEKTLVTDVPVTHPAPEAPSVAVPGFLAPEGEPGSLRGIRDELGDVTGREYTVYADTDASDSHPSAGSFAARVDQRADAAVHLLGETDPDLGIVEVQATDTAFHVCDDGRVFRSIYRAADRFLERVVAAADPDHLLVCSDHGMGEMEGYTVWVNELLRREGLLETTTGEPPPTLGNGLLDDDEEAVSEGETIAWDRSRAFCRTPTECGVRVNLTGREPAGVVAESEYEALRDELVELFEDLTTPAGNPVFETVARREEVFEGPRLTDAPDVVFKPKGMRHVLSSSVETERVFAGPSRAYNHRYEGAYLYAGPRTDAVQSRNVSIRDVAPTAVALLDQPIPERMTGRSIVPARHGRDQYSASASRSEQVDSAIEQRLDDLGYL